MNQPKSSLDSGIDRLEDSPLSDILIPQEDAEQLYIIYPDLPRSYNQGCPSCGKNRGPHSDGVLTIDGEQFICNCKDQLQRHKHYLNAGVGATYQFVDWKHFVGDQEALRVIAEYCSDIHENVEAGIGFLLAGQANGVGKTMLATLAIKTAVMAGYRCFSTTYADMLSSMRAGWRDPNFAKWYKQRIDSAQVLMIDDVGKEMGENETFNQSMAIQTLDSLLRTRVQQNRPTFITTNLGRKGIGGAYGNAVLSLINEQGSVIDVKGQDYREQATKPKRGFRRIY